jgi:UDP-N-acetylglucosamine 2-epimerase (hydrolysing)
VIHGDRVEALAGAIVGALRNILVAHVEGGEVSGTIDDLMRHATSKMSHIHFVASSIAERRLEQLGENKSSIFRIGSPDVDIMVSDSLPTLDQAKNRYDILFDKYAIAILHPVTTEHTKQAQHGAIFVDALLESGENYVLIYPNNDLGSADIFESYERLKGNSRFRVFPSIRFEYFLALLKNALFIIGNSSAGIHEGPVYGVPTINIGSRQLNRLQYQSITNCDFITESILAAVKMAREAVSFPSCDHYGDGKSAQKFMSVLTSGKMWSIPQQKQFRDII